MPSNYNSTTAYLQSVIDSAMASANNNAARIYSLPVRETLREPNFSVSLTDPNVEPPPAFTDVIGDSDEGALVAWLNEQADEWMAKYFPSLNGCLKNQPEEVLCGILSGVKPFGIDSTIFDLVWHQARDRQARLARSDVSTIAAEYSSRGFSLPPGAMVAAIAKVESDGRDTLANVTRDQAIKDADIKVDLLKHAMSLGVQLKLGVMSVLTDFYRQWATLPDKEIERAKAKTQAMAAFYSALSSYYNVEIAFQELNLKAAQTDAEIDIAVDRNRLAHENGYSSTASALGSVTNAFASIASQAAHGSGTLSAQIEAL